MKPTLDRSEFAAGYSLEADEHVRSAVQNLLTIERALTNGEPHHRQLRELFRSLHTLKGLSAMVGLDPIVELAHEMESILRDAERGSMKLAPASIELLLQGVRAIETRIAAFSNQQPVAPAPRQLVEALANLHASAERVAVPMASATLTLDPELLAKLQPAEREHLVRCITSGKRALRVEFLPSAQRAADGVTISSVRDRLGEIDEVVKVIPRALPKTPDAPGGLSFALLVVSDASDAAIAEAACTRSDALLPIALEAAAATPTASPASAEEPDDLLQLNRGFVRVETARLDDAMEKLAAMVVTRFKFARALAALRERGVDVRELSTILADHQRQLRDLRRAITRARMVSVSELLERVPLIVRGMTRTSGKQVRLHIDAGKAELDKAVAERVFPALVHLVRNAVDHAIEAPDERVRRGKAPEGTIRVACHRHSDTQLEIRVSDDGRGIDAAALARRAGRETPGDERGLLELLTLPGLSTLDAATSSSGRGMGMDIVRRIAVELLGGGLTLQTTPGRGTTFSMRLPLSISIVDSFSFVCGAQAFAVPLAIVDEIVDLDASPLVQPPAPSARGAVPSELRLLTRGSEAIPLFGLAALLQLPAASGPGKAFIVRPHGEAFAFAVDRVLGQQEIVVRPIDDPLVKVPGVAGSTDLGDGQPTLVLDLLSLSTMALARAKGAAA